MNVTLHPEDMLPERRVFISARHIVLGAIASRDWQPQHHNHDYAIEAKLPGIILNAPSQIGWFVSYLGGFFGSEIRVARWRMKMHRPIGPSTQLVFAGQVDRVAEDDADLRWAELSLKARVGDDVRSSARILVALAGAACPWTIVGDRWRPPHFVD